MSLKLRWDPTSLDQARSGTIWGAIWLECDGQPFPEVGWNDMLVALFGEFAAAIQSKSAAESVTRRVRFFDGPFWVDVGSISPDHVTLSAEGRYSGVAWQCVVTLNEIKQELRGVGRDVVDTCAMRGWAEQSDVRRLARLLKH